jgi:hypothetical protein
MNFKKWSQRINVQKDSMRSSTNLFSSEIGENDFKNKAFKAWKGPKHKSQMKKKLFKKNYEN